MVTSYRKSKVNGSKKLVTVASEANLKGAVLIKNLDKQIKKGSLFTNGNV